MIKWIVFEACSVSQETKKHFVAMTTKKCQLKNYNICKFIWEKEKNIYS